MSETKQMTAAEPDRIHLLRTGWVSPWITGLEPEADWIDPQDRAGDRVGIEEAWKRQMEREEDTDG